MGQNLPAEPGFLIGSSFFSDVEY